MHFLVGEERHHGVAGIMESVALSGGRLRYQTVPAKALAAAISIGAGASVGPEDPSVQIGSNLGSMAGQLAHLSDERIRTLVAAGAAAGISAAFNAPIAGVFFALEVVLGELGAGSFGMVTLAAVISAVFTQAVSGPEPAFHIPTYTFQGVTELPFYLVLGLITGPIAASYILLLDKAQQLFHHWNVPDWVKPAAAGAAVGVAGIFLPQLFGVGYETIGKALNGESIALGIVLLLLIGKLIITPLSIGGGFPGGVFAPSLFIGAMAGEAFGQLSAFVFPQMHLAPTAFALVGMAAVLAGAVHTPLTAIILLFEMTNDYRIILPVMFAVVVSMVVSQRLQHDSVYTMALARKGLRLQRGRDVDVLESITVSEVMPQETEPLLITQSLASAIDWLGQTRHHGAPVLDEQNNLVGILTLQDFADIDPSQVENLTVGDVCTRDVLTIFPDESIGEALHRMSPRDIGRLPVVARDNPQRLIGVLRRSDLVHAYDVALTKRASSRHRANEVRLGVFSGATVIDLVIRPGAPCANKRISEVQWPQDTVIATLRRGRRIIVPRGDTSLQAGDVLVVVTNSDIREKLTLLCQPVE
jgi:chloride channel protein, CIC family